MSDRPAYCCGVCPAVEPTTAHPDCEACRTGYDCTCRDNPRCPHYQEISMTDQTQTVTAGAIRRAHEWCDLHWPTDENRTPMADVIRHYRATVPAPPATLADEIREEGAGRPPGAVKRVNALADRVEAVEKENRAALNHAYDERDEALVERDEARTKVEEVEGHLSKSWRQRDAKDVELERLSREREQQEKALVEHGRLLSEARAEVERLTSGRTVRESRTVDLPDPADVPNGEAWVVRYKEEQCNGVKAYVGWAIADSYGLRTNIRNDEVILISRLVPDVRRVIDRPEDLDKLPVGSVVIDEDGDPWKKLYNEKWWGGGDTFTAEALALLAAADYAVEHANGRWNLPLHRTEAGYPNCSTCDGGGCPDCTDPA